MFHQLQLIHFLSISMLILQSYLHPHLITNSIQLTCIIYQKPVIFTIYFLYHSVYRHKYQPRTDAISLANTTDTIPDSLIIAPNEILAVFYKELPTSKPIRDDLWHSVPRPITFPSSSETDPDSIIFFVLFQTYPDITPESENCVALRIRPIKYPATTRTPKPKPITSGKRRVCIGDEVL